jgi:hypothetical protein
MRMRKSIKMKVGAVGTALAVTGGLAVIASGTTGAFFSETQPGTVTGTIGAVHVLTSNTTFAWTNMMPGEQKSATVNFTNTGTGPQDFYLVFPNGPALHALNNLGSFGEVHVVGGVVGGQAGTMLDLFDSTNLQDGRTKENQNSCGDVFSPRIDTTPHGCWPLPDKLKIAGTVDVGARVSVSFTFNYAGKLGDAHIPQGWPSSSGGGIFNTYPLTNGEAFGADLAGTPAAGLPFQIVAVQVGQTP